MPDRGNQYSMRLFESILLISVAAMLVIRMVRRNRPYSLWEYFVLLPALMQIAFEGPRWQMYGLYAMVLLMVSLHIINDLMKIKPYIPYKKWHSITGIIIVLISLLLLVLFPVRDLRKPVGPYAVGTMSYDLTDESRTELYGDRKGESRKIRIQLWYPTNDDALGEVAPWIEDGTIVPRGLMKRFNAPFFVYDHITLIDSNSTTDAPLRDDIQSMPVVIISHGWTGFRNLHTDLGEMFASMGYLAISIDHTYGSVGLVFDDGETAPLDSMALPQRGDDDSFSEYAGNLVGTYSGDTGTVINHLAYLDAFSDIFKGHINMDLIGVIGHSTGGGGVVKQAIENPMIDAVVGLDPWVEPIGEEMLTSGMSQPALFFRSSTWADGINDDYIRILYGSDSSHISSYEISGSKHQDFSMLYQMGPVPRLIRISGDTKGYLSADIQQKFIANFMNYILLGSEDNTESLLDEYESVTKIDYSSGQ